MARFKFVLMLALDQFMKVVRNIDNFWLSIVNLPPDVKAKMPPFGSAKNDGRLPPGP